MQKSKANRSNINSRGNVLYNIVFCKNPQKVKMMSLIKKVINEWPYSSVTMLHMKA